MIALLLLLGSTLLAAPVELQNAKIMTVDPLLAVLPALWLTTADQSLMLSRSTAAACSGQADVIVAVDAEVRRQPVDGFGAALTESTALSLDALPPARRDAALEDLFGEAGLALSTLRLPIGSCDFSRGDYSCEDPERCLAPVRGYLRRVKALRPRLTIVGSAWSAPASMKTTGTMRGGALKPDSFSAYASYLASFAKASKKAGFPLDYVTPVNEPGYATESYPTMLMSAAEQARFIGDHLGPALEGTGTRILAFDHNWANVAYPLEVLGDAKAAARAAGAAFHCYEGEPERMRELLKAHPDKEIHFTECTGGGWSGPFGDSFTWAVRKLLIGNLSNGARTVTLWNLALDETGGPTNGGCLDCRGVITVNRYAGDYYREPEYWALAHGTRALVPKARVAASTDSGAEPFPHVALAGDGQNSLIALNVTDRPLRVRVEDGPSCLDYVHPARAAATLRWAAPGDRP